MSILFYIFIYILIAVSFMQDWTILALTLILFFSVRCGAILLIPLAVLIDGYFGNFYTFPYLSVLTLVWYLVVDYVRPKLVNLKFI